MSKGRLSAKRFRHVRQGLVAQQRKDPPQQASPAEVTAKSSRWADVRLVQPVSTTTQQTLLISSVQNVQPDRRPTQAMLRARHRVLHARLVGIQPPRPQLVLTVQLDRRPTQAMLQVHHHVLRVKLASTVPYLRLLAPTASVDSQIQALLRVRHRAQRVQVVNTPQIPQPRNARSTQCSHVH